MLKQSGFTLMELVIAIAIIGILSALAVPGYYSYVHKATRTDATSELLIDAAKMEQYYSQNNTYAGATLANIQANATTTNGTYAIALSNLSATTYTITATATGSQLGDSNCRTFVINESGTRTATNSSGGDSTALCWY